MKKVSELFEAKAYNPWEIATIRNGSAGFRIPEYQRKYDWSSKNIKRLMADIFSSFEYLSRKNDASAFTFLGTLILVKDRKQEPSFKGKSFSIVDGQQRLTTLTLLSCALIERLRILRNTIPSISPRVDNWLEIEANSLESVLFDCVCGYQKVQGRNFYPFPRIVRDDDIRGDSFQSETLKSGIAKFLSKFEKFYQKEDEEFSIPDPGKTVDGEKINENYLEIRGLLEKLNQQNGLNKHDYPVIHADRFQHGGYKQLWKKTHDVLQSDGSKEISVIERKSEIHGYFRTLMLGSYFCNYVAVTTVITPDESAAFDIFDALNTTGEPLTALETLKPQVIKTVNELNGKYEGSPCDISFKNIDEIMANYYPETKQKQDETKNLIVTFFLYMEGRKIPLDLSIQRRELLLLFQKSKNKTKNPAKFIEALSDVSKYRCDYWLQSNIGRINRYHPDQSEAETVKLLCSLISATKASLTIPILARYWVDGNKNNNDYRMYIDVLKAISAFLILRRAATGGTAGIDTCFREIMETGNNSKKFGLCTGLDFEEDILELDVLKSALRSKLEISQFKFKSKQEWIDHVVNTPIYSSSQPIARFLLFCANHNTDQDTDNTGLVTREGKSKSDDRDFLTFDKWNSEHYRTVEHVAPNSDKPDGWDLKIYTSTRDIRNTLGNLILLPSKENSVVGTASWPKKKLFYSALTNKNIEERKKALKKANREGMKFKASTEDLIRSRTRLSMLDGIGDVPKWDKDFIEKRSRRLAALAWDKLWPWLN